ncbi:rhodanese-like domain-containing protein [Piscibacillus halophilus]|mgnify:CR=1 FL=1|uniref:Rhodanese-related sulfurtransferase n=1 Tax=Piscibacillus halophilus TaxID=571933 RepID=A0A1H9MMC2_9BACI|nr:rhodanese-like domain-containing protein [Piscibacillus halophilus]SER24846.1 Rhodanese-related sulfurtransferase [Piscibacillus halophilus]
MSDEINEITPEELEQELNSGKYEIVDVREDDEVANGMIPGATHIALNTIPERIDELNKDKEYVMVCRSGRRSYNASLYLQEQGYKVHNLKGGMLEWTGEVIA